MNASSGPLLETRSLSKFYGAMCAISDLSIDVGTGGIIGIGGPNGAGKTTLFDIISGLTKPTQGAILFEGKDITGLSPAQICHLGISRTFQLNALFDTMTVRENLLCGAYFGFRNLNIPGFRFDRASHIRTAQALEITGTTEIAEEQAGSLPILQRKLVMLGSAIASRPKLLLLDEPVGGLNPREIEHCAAVFRTLQDAHGMTIVLIEHVMRFMTALSDRIIILHHGKKLYDGDASSVAHDREVVDVYLGSSGARDADRSLVPADASP